MRLDSQIGMEVFKSDDAREGPTAFMEKRTPELHGDVSHGPTSTCSTATASPRASPTSGSRGCAPTARSPPRGARRPRLLGGHQARRRHRLQPRRRHVLLGHGRGGVVGLEDDLIEQSEAEEAGGRMMLMMDPPDHTRYRKLVNRGFTPRMINVLEPHIRELDLEDPRRRDRQRGVRLRRGRRRRAPPRGHRRAHRRTPRGTAQDLRLEQPHGRLRGPRVRGEPGRGVRGAGRDVHVRAGAGRGHAGPSPRTTSSPRSCRRGGRRRLALGHGLQPVLPAAVRRRQRDHAQRDRPRHERAPREP